MKLIIPDSKVKNVITNYLNYNIHPDYNWGPDLFDFYEKDVKEYGFHVFYINDAPAYEYLGEYDGYDFLYRLDIMDFVSDKLTSLFGDLWIPVFKEWFEKNSNLEVREIKIDGEIIRL
jgi:hypothetical protein